MNRKRIPTMETSLTVATQAMIWSSISAEKHLNNILEYTRGVVFLGTPHSGSGFAVAAEALAKWIGALRQTNAKILEVLRSDSEVLARIQAGFQNLVRARAQDPAHSIAITCFYEEIPLVGVGEVTTKAFFSAVRAWALDGKILTVQNRSSQNTRLYCQLIRLLASTKITWT